ncbi:MAG: hypothetical protein ACRD1T_00880, partial [Acidimicrobiia bacterium]
MYAEQLGRASSGRKVLVVWFLHRTFDAAGKRYRGDQPQDERARRTEMTPQAAGRSWLHFSNLAPRPLGGLQSLVARLDSSKPDFSPVGEYRSLTEEPTFAQVANTGDSFEHNAGIGQMHHPSRSLVYDIFHAAQHAKATSAVSDHLHVKPKAAIAIVLVERRE